MNVQRKAKRSGAVTQNWLGTKRICGIAKTEGARL